MTERTAKFAVGQIIRHRLFSYREVIADVDPVFLGTDEWYEQMARSLPPRDRPWYHVLVHDAQIETYVAERNLEPDDSGDPVRHPDLDLFFTGVRDGVYISHRMSN